MLALYNLFGFLTTLISKINLNVAKSYGEKVAENIKNNLEPSLLLLLTGMVGIFVVMVILMIVIFILNKTTQDKKDDDEK